MDPLKDLITFVARSLVDDPEAVDVQAVDEGNVIVYELAVAPADLGKVIGKEGRTARAIRTLISASSAKSRKRAVLEILE
jgi:predicted RNA-binding protein YlqC (UPF0109 family)